MNDFVDLMYDMILESLCDYVESGELDIDEAEVLSEAAYDELYESTALDRYAKRYRANQVNDIKKYNELRKKVLDNPFGSLNDYREMKNINDKIKERQKMYDGRGKHENIKDKLLSYALNKGENERGRKLKDLMSSDKRRCENNARSFKDDIKYLLNK